MSSKNAIITGEGGSVTVRKASTQSLARKRRELVYTYHLRGLDVHQIAALVSKKMNRDVAANRVRRDLEVMRKEARGKVVDADAWDEIAEHCDYFEYVCKLATLNAANPKLHAREVTSYLQLGITSRESLIRLQKDVGIIKTVGNRGKQDSGVLLPGSDGEVTDIDKLSFEQMVEAAEEYRDDPDIAELLADAESVSSDGTTG